MPKKTLDLVNSVDRYHVRLKSLFDSMLNNSSNLKLSGRIAYDALTFTLTQTEVDADTIYCQCIFRSDTKPGNEL